MKYTFNALNVYLGTIIGPYSLERVEITPKVFIN